MFEHLWLSNLWVATEVMSGYGNPRQENGDHQVKLRHVKHTHPVVQMQFLVGCCCALVAEELTAGSLFQVYTI